MGFAGLNARERLFPKPHEIFATGFYHGGFDFAVRSILGKTARGGADAGEVLATITGVKSGDHPGWFEAWTQLADRIAATAATSQRGGHRVSAARAFLRAANYYAVALEAIDGLPDTAQLLPTFRAHRAAWESFVDESAWAAERVDIPYEKTSLPGWFVRPDDSMRARPTFVMNNGSDGSISGLWCEGAEGAIERGYNVLLFDGPGQQSMLFERGTSFRPDWEAVITPVVDFLASRGDVDTARLVLYGVSQAGYWVPRVLAFEHRFAAAVVDGGVVDVSTSWLSQIPRSLQTLYGRGEKGKFDRNMAIGMKLPGGKATAATWTFRSRPYGTSGYSATLDEVRKYTVRDVAAQVTTPLLVTAPEDDQFFPGQSQELAALVEGAELMEFSATEGANGHCQPLGRELTEQRVFDGLAGRVPGVG